MQINADVVLIIFNSSIPAKHFVLKPGSSLFKQIFYNKEKNLNRDLIFLCF
jgi:hypothetical protein